MVSFGSGRKPNPRGRWWALLILFLLGGLTVQAENYAVMNTGFRLAIKSHDSAGSLTRLFLVGGGVAEVQTASIHHFEADEYTPPPPASARAAGTPLEATGLHQIVQSSGERHGLDPDLIHSVIRAESAGNPRAVSVKGAIGLMQLMPDTARTLNVSDVFDPAQNVEAGTRYLRRLLDAYKSDLALALAAYNAGPEKVAAYRGIPPYRETRSYVSRVIRAFNQKKMASGTSALAPQLQE